MGGYSKGAVAQVFAYPALLGLLFGYDIGPPTFVPVPALLAAFEAVGGTLHSPAATTSSIAAHEEEADLQPGS